MQRYVGEAHVGIEREKIDFSDPENVRLLKSGKLGYYIRDYLEYVITKALTEALTEFCQEHVKSPKGRKTED